MANRTRELEGLNQQLMEYAFYNSHKVRGPLCRIMGLVNLISLSPTHQHEYLLEKLAVSTDELDDAIKAINHTLQTVDKNLPTTYQTHIQDKE